MKNYVEKEFEGISVFCGREFSKKVSTEQFNYDTMTMNH